MAVFQELHSGGTTAASLNTHFHVSIKSSKQHPWAPIALYLRQKERVFVHFAMSGDGYHSAFRYGWWPTNHKPVAELDKEFLLLNGTEVHPSPVDAAKRPFFCAGKNKRSDFDKEESHSSDEEEAKEAGTCDEDPTKTKREPLWAYAFRLIRENELWSGDLFQSYVQRTGEARLISLCMQKSAASIVEKARHVLQADTRLNRSQQSRLDILREAAGKRCTCTTSGEWARAAIDLFRLQQISASVFAAAMLRALETGAAKGVNVFIFGVTSSAKSWVLDPLRFIFACHITPPPKANFPLQDLPVKEVILWQDFRVNEDVIPWNSLLLLFEGTQVNIRRPRTEFIGDLDYDVVQPVFITSSSRLHHHDIEERKMMDGRFQFFQFSKTVPSQQRRKISPCGQCFASLWISLCTPHPEAPQISSQEIGSSSKTPFCGTCGLLRLSSPFCTSDGRKHG
jgi:hypothetical protein